MMRIKTKTTGKGTPETKGSSAGHGSGSQLRPLDWEMRPSGMLVQKRNSDSNHVSIPPRMIRVRVKYGSTCHEISISSEATFGELKKMLAGPTGLHHQDQKLMFKDKERDSKAFLDTSGVKDRSKIVLIEDPICQEKRYLEMRKNANREKASKSISEISLEVDKLANQVSALESIIIKSGKVAEKDVVNLIESLMNQLLKLDGIMGDGDIKLQRKMQVTRVQKYVETLDVLKIKNAMMPTSTDTHQTPMQVQQRNTDTNGQRQTTAQEHQQPMLSNGNMPSPTKENQMRHPVAHSKSSNGHSLSPSQERQARHSVGLLPTYLRPHQEQRQPARHSTSGTVVTTKWETFDSTPAPVPIPGSNSSVQPKFNWDLI